MVTAAAASLTLGVCSVLLVLISESAAGPSRPLPYDGRLVLEEGYAISTLIDGNKLGSPLHPYSLFPLPDPPRGHGRLLLLDTANSAFYTISLPVSQGSEVKRLSGNGMAGFSDGDTTTAMFKNPRSFAVDFKGNVYVADRSNFAIRKITASGMTTTIAGGYSGNKTGHVDGPAQNATFSNDFDLVFVPKMCALLISDRGNRLIREISLKPDDCVNESHSGLGTGSISLKDSGECSSTKTQKHCQTHLVTVAVTLFSDLRSAAAKSAPFSHLQRLACLSLSYVCCIFRIPRKAAGPVMVKKPPSLLDSDASCNHGAKTSNVFADQLKDLIRLGGDPGASDVSVERKDGAGDMLPDISSTNLDGMIRANILEFTNKAKQQELTEQSSASGSTLLKRRPRGVVGA